MTWRRPVDELEPERDAQGRLGNIPVLLECGHVRRDARWLKSYLRPSARQWCRECHAVERPQKSSPVRSLDIRKLAEDTAKGWLEDGATGNAPGLELADYIEVAIEEALQGRK